MGRREFLQLASFGALWGAAYAFKKTVLNPIPDFAIDKFPRASSSHKNTAIQKGIFVWDDEYHLNFVDKYLRLAKFVQEKSGTQILMDFTAHPFPVQKYKLAKEKSLNEGTLEDSDFANTAPLTIADLFRVHSKGYVLKLYLMGYSYTGIFNGENPIVPEIVDYARIASGGTYTASQIALEKGIAMNINGGFHHAMGNHEYGFCYINDVAIAIKNLRSEKKIRKAMVVDMDIHHGDGNARIMGNDPSVAIFDIYQEDNFPKKKYPVDYPISIKSKYLDGGINDNIYFEAIKGLPAAIEREKPDLMVYLAGADPHKNDMLGNFKLTKKGLMNRDEYVIESARTRDIPVTVVLAGGYPKRIQDIVDINSNTILTVKKYSC